MFPANSIFRDKKNKEKKIYNTASAVSTSGLDTETSIVKGAEKEFHADEWKTELETN